MPSTGSKVDWVELRITVSELKGRAIKISQTETQIIKKQWVGLKRTANSRAMRQFQLNNHPQPLDQLYETISKRILRVSEIPGKKGGRGKYFKK